MTRNRGLAAVALIVVVCAAAVVTLWTLARPSPVDEASRDLPQGSFTVQAQDLGVHANHSKPDVPLTAIRLNCYPTWRESNPAPGVYDWSAMDMLVDRARSWGYEEVLHSFCATPMWAAEQVGQPGREVLGANSTSAPTSMDAWVDYITEVVKRYKGRITAYQAWNEPTTPQFFQGTPAQMAEMTDLMHRVVSEHDPDAQVVAASLQQVEQYQRDWGLAYLEQLKARDWPVDVISFHGYAPKDTLADGRQAVIMGFQDQLSALQAPDLPLWDTETTYTGRPLKDSKAAALVVRSYLDSWRMGVDRTYWYIWYDGDNPFGSIQMRPGSMAAQALGRLFDRTVGATFQGCQEDANGLVECRFERAGAPFTILWAEERPVEVPLGEDMVVEDLATGERSTASEVSAGRNPLLVGALLS